jgi:transposase-like protein
MLNEEAEADYWDVSDCLSENYVKNVFKVRRYICRVCKMKFQPRRDTQAHIKDEHRRVRGKT